MAQSGNHPGVVELNATDEIRVGSQDVQDRSKEEGGDSTIIFSMNTYRTAPNGRSGVVIPETLHRKGFDCAISLKSAPIVEYMSVSTGVIKTSMILRCFLTENRKHGDNRGIADGSNESKRWDLLLYNVFGLFRVGVCGFVRRGGRRSGLTSVGMSSRRLRGRGEGRGVNIVRDGTLGKR